MIDNIALVGQICVEESAKYHNLIVRNGYTAKLRPLLIRELAVEEDELPRGLLHVVRLRKVDPLDGAERGAVVDSATAADRVDERLSEEASGERVPLLRELGQRLPLVRSYREALRLSHGSLAVPAANRNELTSHGYLNKCVVGPAIDHLRSLDERPVALIKLKELPSLLSAANVDLTVHGALEDGAEVAEWVLDVLQVDSLAREVLQVVHDDLLSVRHEYSYPVVFRILFQASLRLQDLHFHLLEAREINLVQDLVLNFFEVFLLEGDLV